MVLQLRSYLSKLDSPIHTGDNIKICNDRYIEYSLNSISQFILKRIIAYNYSYFIFIKRKFHLLQQGVVNMSLVELGPEEKEEEY